MIQGFDVAVLASRQLGQSGQFQHNLCDPRFDAVGLASRQLE